MREPQRALSVTFIIVLVGVISCTGNRSPGTAPEVPPGITLNVPDSIGGFSLADRQVFDDPSFGTRLRYEGADSMYADVYLYPGPRLGAPCDGASAADAASQEIKGFTESFPTLIERGYYDSVSIARDESLQPESATPWCAGRHLTLNVVRDGAPQHSQFYLYVLSGYFVKVRMTYPFSEARLALDRVFVGDLFARLQRK